MTRLYYERGPVKLFHGDCLEWFPSLEPLDAIITDPPYGCGKADWDAEFPTKWFSHATEKAPLIGIITGSAGLKDSIRLVGDRYVDVIAARNLNGMTRGPIGYGNWLGCVIAGNKPRMGPNCFDFTVHGDMPNHPSPKPIDYMVWIVDRLTEEGQLIGEPFTGSGTTAIACIRNGRRFVGCELEEEYCELTARRIDRELDQGKLFDKPVVPQPVQKSLLG